MVSKFASQPMSWNQMYQYVSKVYSSLPSHTYQMRPTKHVLPERSECPCNPASSEGPVARSTQNGFKKVQCENTDVVVQLRNVASCAEIVGKTEVGRRELELHKPPPACPSLLAPISRLRTLQLPGPKVFVTRRTGVVSTKHITIKIIVCYVLCTLLYS